MAKEHMVVYSDGDVGVIVETRFNDSNWFVLVDFGEGKSARFVWVLPKSLTHYHVPTVEDLLRDMHAKLNEVTALYVGEAIDSDERDSDETRIFAEYATKLQLKEEA